MQDVLRARLQKAINEHIFPGCIVGVITKKQDPLILPVGMLTYEHDSPAVTEATLYDVASVTKSIPVSSLALKLIDSGELRLQEPVRNYLPELQTSHAEEITPWHLLTQTLDYRVSLASLKDLGAEAILKAVLTQEFTLPPGERMNYVNATSIVLGLLVERVSGRKLDELAETVFFGPLGMTDTTFHPEGILDGRIAPTEIDPWRGRIVQGEIHDESAYVLREKMIAGSAGLFSTASDLLKFLKMLVQHGTYEGKTYFSQAMIGRLQENQLAAIGGSAALGWELNQPWYMGTSATEKTIGKTGFTGCMVLCDIPRETGIVLLANYHFPTRKNSPDAANAVRRDIADIVITEALA
jgi:CubicO group peptidase (beta-lactamase class C family)